MLGLILRAAFFTNCYAVMIDRIKNTGQTPGWLKSSFAGECQAFLNKQVLFQKPKLIVALGGFVPEFIAESGAVKAWKGCQKLEMVRSKDQLQRGLFREDGQVHECQIVSILHPSYAGNYKKLYGDHEAGKQIEIDLLSKAKMLAGL
ncbi:MAG: hypothetical protein R6W92_15880 [Desulfocurvibacter africanus]